MQQRIRVVALVALAAFCVSSCSESTSTGDSQPMHIFLLAGQSNMSGRGELSDIDRAPHPRVFVLNKNDEWVIATEPLHFDKPERVGVGPGLAFAKEIARENPDITIGLVPSAVGASSIQTWTPGGYHEKNNTHPWDDAVRRLGVAMQSGELKAILWHQGEADSGRKAASLYEARLHDLIRRFRNVADDDKLPFIVGQLGQFKEWSEGRQLVNAVHENVPAHFEYTRFVSSDDLTHIGDKTHFDADSARALGHRYADAFADILSTDKPIRTRYLEALIPLVDQLVSTQITDPNDSDYGALVSPSTNPQPNPRHSRAAEAVYPLAVAFKHTGDERYKTAAILLGNWLVGIQQEDGAWGENWPDHDGWNGTTADQLISLAGALNLLREDLKPAKRQAWETAISKAADFSLDRFPGTSNINYTPTAAVGLVLAHRAVEKPKAIWLEKAESLIAHVASKVNDDNLITGEGKGVDLGYNIAQTIGFIAWYGILQDSPETVDLAASVLKTHLYFMYPNGAIDNSWGTRSFKWTLESGSKTAPGVHFTFGLLVNKDPTILRGARLALDWLENHSLDAENRVVYGPHAYLHENSNPPSNYLTFARAQSIATAIEYGPEATELAPIPAEQHNWVQFFPTTETAVLRTEQVMATLSSYANNLRYPLETAVRGGSATVVWFEGYGATGFLQVSSQTEYRRIETKHMPDGIDPLPLTPRIETSSGTYYTNLFDPDADLKVAELPAAIEVVSSGTLRSKDGDIGSSFTWTHVFSKDSYSKTVALESAAVVQIVEPFVDNPGNSYALDGDDTFVITAVDGGQWQLKIEASNVPYTLSHGDQRERYYHPFPGVNAYPLTIRLESSGPASLSYTISAR